MSHRIVQPQGWAQPRGYSNGMAARGEILAIAGQIGWDANQRLVEGGFLPQLGQAIDNVIAVLDAAGGKPDHIIGLTIYVKHKRDYTSDLSAVGELYRDRMGKHFPAMALVEVSDLLEPGALVEIQALAVLP